MDSKIAIIGIIVDDIGSVAELNEILHEFAQYIIGRMGIPYRAKNMNIISVAIDAPHDVISAMAGKIGNLKGVSAKTVYSGCVK